MGSHLFIGQQGIPDVVLASEENGEISACFLDNCFMEEGRGLPEEEARFVDGEMFLFEGGIVDESSGGDHDSFGSLFF